MRAILRPFAFVLGGALAVGLVVALFTLGQTPSFPYLVLSAAGAGLVSWLGLGIGVVLRKRRSGAMPSNAKLLLITVLVLLIYVVLGAAFVLIATPIFTSNYAQGVDRLLLIASIASVPLLFGISLGYNDWPNAALGSIIGLWQGALVGVAFGLGAAIVIWITYVPPCAHPSLHCINFPPLFDAGFIFIISLFVGFGLGLADAGAAAVGLLTLSLPTRKPARNQQLNALPVCLSLYEANMLPHQLYLPVSAAPLEKHRVLRYTSLCSCLAGRPNSKAIRTHPDGWRGRPNETRQPAGK